MRKIEFHPTDDIAEYNDIDEFSDMFNELWDELFNTQEFLIEINNYGWNDKNMQLYKTYSNGKQLLCDITEHASQWSIKIKLNNDCLEIKYYSYANLDGADIKVYPQQK